MSYLEQEKYIYSDYEKQEMLVHSIKANKVCSEIRKKFNLCRGNLQGKLIDPTYCEPDALSLIDCFQKVRKDTGECKQIFDKIMVSMETKTNCDELLSNYLTCNN